MLDWKKLVTERNEWVDRNFPNPDPEDSLRNSVFGVMEEVGELAHAHLKEKQSIRGTEDHVAKAKDAIGDIIIYLLGVMNYYSYLPVENAQYGQPHWETSPDSTLLSIGVRMGHLSRTTRSKKVYWTTYPIGGLVYYCQRYCELRGWDFEEIVITTWGSVKQRDWVANPDDADEKVNEADKLVPDLHSTTDAMVWAEQFTALFQGEQIGHDLVSGGPIVGEGLMVGWFANAMAAQEVATQARIRKIIANNPRDRALQLLNVELGVLPT